MFTHEIQNNENDAERFRIGEKGKTIRNLMSFVGLPRKSFAVETAQSDLLLAESKNWPAMARTMQSLWETGDFDSTIKEGPAETSS